MPALSERLDGVRGRLAARPAATKTIVACLLLKAQFAARAAIGLLPLPIIT